MGIINVIVNHYIEGATIKLSAKFYINGVLTDPTTITLKVKTPTNTISTYTYVAGQITKDGVGIYSKNIVCSPDGLWIYKFIGTGAVEAVGERRFTVLASQID